MRTAQLSHEVVLGALGFSTSSRRVLINICVAFWSSGIGCARFWKYYIFIDVVYAWGTTAGEQRSENNL